LRPKLGYARRFHLAVDAKPGHAGTETKSSRIRLALARRLLAVAPPPEDNAPEEPPDTRPRCPCCGGQMVVIEPSPAGSTPARRRLHYRQTGRSRHDPAWIASSTPRSHCASGDVTACTITASSRPDDHIRQRSRSGSTSLASHNPGSHGPSWCLGYSSPHQPKPENPIAHRVPPAVRASGTSLRLRRPEPFAGADWQVFVGDFEKAAAVQPAWDDELTQ
jgi:hypothetical protein